MSKLPPIASTGVTSPTARSTGERCRCPVARPGQEWRPERREGMVATEARRGLGNGRRVTVDVELPGLFLPLGWAGLRAL